MKEAKALHLEFSHVQRNMKELESLQPEFGHLPWKPLQQEFNNLQRNII